MMTRKKKHPAAIPKDVQTEVEAIVERFNHDKFSRDDCYYEPRFDGKYCFLYRFDYGRAGPICRLTYTGKMDAWEFAIFKWSSKTYDPTESFFPGSELVDGTVEGAMGAGLEAYAV